MRRLGILFCLLVCESVVAFLVCVGPTAAHEHDDSVVVQVTDKGFEPESVEVGSGDTVVFENVDQNAHWPASDDHPMHTRYPEFDPRKPLEPNAEWSFAFDKPGEWKYHDYQNSHLRGEILVQADEEPGASADGGRAGT